jgi:hypothetical protein
MNFELVIAYEEIEVRLAWHYYRPSLDGLQSGSKVQLCYTLTFLGRGANRIPVAAVAATSSMSVIQ